MQESARLNRLIDEGDYAEAGRLVNLWLKRLQDWQHAELTTPFLPYVVKFDIETGKISKASAVLDAAEKLAARFWDYNINEPVLFREKAEFDYACSRYQDAAIAAAKAYRLSNDHRYSEVRTEYCRSLQALALMRVGKTVEAEQLATAALRSAPKGSKRHSFFVPRVLYAVCLVEGHMGRAAEAEAHCRNGLAISAESKKETRDLGLGYLALAEVLLQSEDLSRSREAALQSTSITARLFGTQHQDMVDGLVLLGRVSMKQGDRKAARAWFESASKTATALFGEGSPGAAIPLQALHDAETSGPGGERH